VQLGWAQALICEFLFIVHSRRHTASDPYCRKRDRGIPGWLKSDIDAAAHSLHAH
jgi:hypothetical protein